MTYHRWTEADHDKLRELTAAGMTAIEIAQVIGSTPGTVAMKRQALGLYAAGDSNTCQHCGAELTQKGRGRRSKFCNTTCQDNARNVRDRQKMAEERATDTCEVCGELIAGQRESRRYCSRNCSQRAWYEQNKHTPEFKAARAKQARAAKARRDARKTSQI